jgi:hypothetical protein
VKEEDGAALLFDRFTEAGYSIARNVRFREEGVDVELDGWDASARVGFEYITKEAGDDVEFDAATLERFEARMRKGELFVLLIDEREALTANALDAAARGFLGELAKLRAGRAP